MMHPRKEIRAAVVAILKAATGTPPQFPTDAGARVFDSRDIPLGQNTPATILVYTMSEEIDRDQFHEDGTRRRTATMMVECYDLGDDGAETVDRMAWQVENALRADPTLGGRVERCDLISTNVAFEAEGEVSLWVAGLAFEVVYWTHEKTDGGTTPRIVMVGFEPLTGPGNEPHYDEFGGVIDG